ncbi:hypothetical protein [Nocardia sp. Marseille-Q1738]
MPLRETTAHLAATAAAFDEALSDAVAMMGDRPDEMPAKVFDDLAEVLDDVEATAAVIVAKATEAAAAADREDIAACRRAVAAADEAVLAGTDMLVNRVWSYDVGNAFENGTTGSAAAKTWMRLARQSITDVTDPLLALKRAAMLCLVDLAERSIVYAPSAVRAESTAACTSIDRMNAVMGIDERASTMSDLLRRCGQEFRAEKLHVVASEVERRAADIDDFRRFLGIIQRTPLRNPESTIVIADGFWSWLASGLEGTRQFADHWMIEHEVDETTRCQFDNRLSTVVELAAQGNGETRDSTSEVAK